MGRGLLEMEMIITHAWRVLWDRLPTKDDLQRRNILSSSDDLKCVLCGDKEEPGRHIFFECEFSYKVFLIPSL
ncbi:hypothetical protein ACS0TY_013940 [Phlomoides rotata]